MTLAAKKVSIFASITVLSLLAVFLLPSPGNNFVVQGLRTLGILDEPQVNIPVSNEPINATTLSGKSGLYYLNAANLTGVIDPEHFSAYDSLVKEGRIGPDSVIQTDQNSTPTPTPTLIPQPTGGISEEDLNSELEGLRIEMAQKYVSGVEAGLGLSGGGGGATQLNVVPGEGIIIQNDRVVAVLGDSVNLLTEVAGVLSIANGGTGLATPLPAGKILTSSGSGYAAGSLVAGDGVQLTLTGNTYTYSVDTTVCRTTGNCSGSGAGIVGGGVAGQIAFFTAGDTLSSSAGMSWNSGASQLAVTGSINSTAGYQVNGVSLNTSHVLEGANLYYTQARFDTAFGNKDTDDLVEGSALYWTNSRFDSRLATKTTTDLVEGSRLYYTDVRVSANSDVAANSAARHAAATVSDSSTLDLSLVGQQISGSIIQSGLQTSLLNNDAGFIVNLSGFDADDLAEGGTNWFFTSGRFDLALAGKDSDDIAEGSTNFYFTDGRFDDALAGKDADDLAEGSTNQFFTTLRFDTAFSFKDTDDLAEGSNLYYTEERVSGNSDVVANTTARHAAATVSDTTTVDLTLLGQQISANVIQANLQTSLLNNDAGFLTGLGGFDTDDLAQGTTNQYYSGLLFDVDFATKTTDDLTQGSTNLYSQWVNNSTNLTFGNSVGIGAATAPTATLDVTGTFATSGAVTLSNYTTNGGILYTNGSGVVAQLGAGGSGQCLVSNGSGSAPSWAGCAESGTLTGSGNSGELAYFSSGSSISGTTELVWNSIDGAFEIGGDVDITGAYLINGSPITTDNVAEGTALYWTTTRFDSQLATKDTDDLAEGANLYYTDVRVSDNTDVAANTAARHDAVTISDTSTLDLTLVGQLISGTVIQSGLQTSLFNNDAGFIVNLSGFDSDDLDEGLTNLYYSEDKVSANTDVAANTAARHDEATVLDSTTINFTLSGQQITGVVIQSAIQTSLLNNDAGFIVNLSGFDTDDLTEGSTNKYYSDALFGTSLALRDSDDVAQGTTNVYYTTGLFEADFGNQTTDDLAQGLTSLYSQWANNSTNITFANSVGIGAATAPTATLDVTGTAYISGAVTLANYTNNGGVLYTNGSGQIAQTAAGGSEECLQSDGSGGLSWGACDVEVGKDWVARQAAEANWWKSVAYGNGQFVAVSSIGTNRVMTSSDGVTWTARSAAEANNWTSVTYGNGKFVAVASDGANRVMTSSDGVTWVAQSASEESAWTDITFANGVFVAVADTGTNRIMTSSNGSSWTSRSVTSGQYKSVSYGNGVFATLDWAGSNNGQTSSNGTTWSSNSSNPTSVTNTQDITFGNGVFVALRRGTSNQIIGSKDGVNWSNYSTIEDNNWNSIAYGNGVFVAVAQSGANLVATSGSPIETITPNNNTYQGGMTINGGLISSNGLTISNLATDGGILYTNGSGVVAQTGVGGAGECLKSNAGGAPTWGSCATSSAITGTGIAGQIAFFDSSSNLAGESALQWDATTDTLLLTGDISIAGDIVPSTDNTYSLGSPSYMWQDVYIGPGSLYINGQKVLQESGESIVVSADPGQNLSLTTAGGGDLELTAAGGGVIQLKSNVQLTGGNSITTSDTTAVLLPNGLRAGNIQVVGNAITTTNTNGDIAFTPNGAGDSYFTTGNLGVGNSNPGYKLDVTGSINASTGYLLNGVTLSTTNIAEGTNLYFTQGRFDTAFGNKDTDDLAVGSTNLYYTGLLFDADFATKNTDDLVEGSTNLYFSDTLVSANADVSANTAARHAAATVSDSSTLDLTVVGQLISGTVIQSGLQTSLLNNDAGFIANLSGFDTDDLAQGSTNFYYASSLFDADLATKDSDDVAQGSTNLYSQWANNSTNITFANSVGIGAATAPAATLDVTGTLAVSGAVTLANYTTSGGLLHTDGSGTISQLAAGSDGQCLTWDSGLSWDSCGSSLPSDNVTGTGANGQLTFWNGTNTQTGSANLAWNNATLALNVGTGSSGFSAAGSLSVLGGAHYNTTRINPAKITMYTSQWASGEIEYSLGDFTFTNVQYEPEVCESSLNLSYEGNSELNFCEGALVIKDNADSSNRAELASNAGIQLSATDDVTIAGTSDLVIAGGGLTIANGLTLTAGALSLPADSVTDAMVSNTLTASIFAGSGSTSNAVDLATAEVGGVLGIANGGTNSTATPTDGGIAYGDGTGLAYTAVGTSGQCLQSDGTNAPVWGACDVEVGSDWVARETPVESNNWYAVAYGNNKFVAVANSGTNRIMTSPDGVVWTPSPAPAASNWRSITYGNGLFVAVAQTGTDRVMTSPDGINWTLQTAPVSSEWRSVTYGNGIFVAVAWAGDANRVMTSPDGITWTVREAAEANEWFSVTYGNGKFVAVARSGTNQVMTSTDGITWNAVEAAEANMWFSVTYGNGQFVAVAGTGTHRVMTSPDGQTWTPRAHSDNSGWYSIAYGNGMYVAVAESGVSKVMTSPDGINWTTRSLGFSSPIWLHVGYGNGMFVAVGGYNGTAGRIMTSGHQVETSNPHNNIYQGGMTINGGLASNNGLTLSNLTTNGGLLYTNGSGVVAQLGAGSSGQCLQSAGGGAPVWADCDGEIASNSIDFDKIADALTLDAATSIDLGSNSITTSGSGGLTFNHTGISVFAGAVMANAGLVATDGFALTGGGLTLPANSVTDAMVSNTLTSSIFIGSGSTTNAVDLGTAEVSGTLAAANIADDSLDFTKLMDSMTVDANTDMAIGSGITLSTSGLGDVAFNHSGKTTFAGSVGIGSGDIAQSGAIRMALNSGINYRNSTNDGDITAFRVDPSNILHIGNGAIQTTNPGGANTLYVEGNNGNVGIGTSIPSAKFVVQGSNDSVTYGPEKVTNGDFTSGTDWTYGTSWSHDAINGEVVTSGHASATLSQDVGAVPGEIYKVTYTIKNATSGYLRPSLGGSSFTRITGLNGVQTEYVQAVTNGNLEIGSYISSFVGSIDDVSVTKVNQNSAMVVFNSSEGTAALEFRSGGDGLNNSFIGLDVGKLNAIGFNNTGLGAFAFASNASGYDNTAIGNSALRFNTSGVANSALGGGALYSNISGASNSAFGHDALYSNTTGSFNIAIGVLALTSNTSAQFNTGVGNSALRYNTTGSNNTGIGYTALFNNTTGSRNTGLGIDAGRFNQAGSNNVFIGYQAGRGTSDHDKSGNIFIGYQAGYNETGSNLLYIENSNSATPLIHGDFATDELTFNGSVTITNGLTVSAGTVSLPAGSIASSTIADDSLNFDKIADALVLDGATSIAMGAFDLTTSGTGGIYFDHTGETAFAGNVGIGVEGSGYKLDVQHAGAALLRALSTGANNAAFTLGSEQTGRNVYFEFAEDDNLIFQMGKSPTNYFYFYDAANDQDAIRIEANGAVSLLPAGTDNVAIGKYSASAKLDVEGTFRASGAVTLANYTTNGGILYTNSSGVIAQLGAGTTGQCLQANTGAAASWGACDSGIGADSLNFSDFSDSLVLDASTSIALGSNTLSTSGTGGLVFGHTGDSSFAGNVGIGTSSPDRALEIAGGGELLRLTGTIADAPLMEFANEFGVQVKIGISPGDEGLGFHTWDEPVRFYTNLDNSEERLTIMDDGSIGINNSDPGRLLEIIGAGVSPSTGNADLRVVSTGGAGAGIELSATGTGGQTWTIFSASEYAGAVDGSLSFWNKDVGVYGMVMSSNGAVGIGNNGDPVGAAGTLHLWGEGENGSESVIYFGDRDSGSNPYIGEYGAGDSDMLAIQGRLGTIINPDGGNVGVGNNDSLSAQLHVTSDLTTNSGLLVEANSLSTAKGVSVTSTSTSLSSGGLLGLDWSPSSTTIMTGDLFSINVGANGTVGNLLNIMSDGLSVFSVSQTQITANVPVAFMAAGDMNIAYDLYFSNPTVGNIKSAGPLSIRTGETFGSSNLTLQTYNSGSIILDSQTIQALGITTIGSGGNTITLSETGVVYAGTARPTRTITLSPEYNNSAQITDGSGTTNGTMALGNSGSATSWRNYYQWSSAQATLQDYTIAVRVTLPEDFDEWDTTGFSLSYQTGTANTADNAVSAQITESSQTTAACSLTTDRASTTWTNTNMTCAGATLNDGSNDWDAAGQTAIIRIKVKAKNTASALARVGDIELKYKAKF